MIAPHDAATRDKLDELISLCEERGRGDLAKRLRALRDKLAAGPIGRIRAHAG